MITEIRRLVFSATCIRNAFDLAASQKRAVLPTGAVDRVELMPHGAMKFYVKDALLDEARQVNLEMPVVGAVMMRYLMTQKVPLPKKARKSLTVVGGHMVLDVVLNPDEELDVAQFIVNEVTESP